MPSMVAPLAALNHEGLFHDLMDAAPDAMVLTGTDGVIIDANAGVEALFGYDRQELVGRSVEALMPERQRGLHVAHRGHYVTAPSRRRMGAGLDLSGCHRDGSEFAIDVALNPLRLGAQVLVVVAIRDMSPWRRLEDELRCRAQDLKEADRHKDRFLATLAHELRSPLAALQQVAELIRDPPDDDLRAWASAVVERQSAHMLGLVEELTDVTRVSNGKMTICRERIDLSLAVASAVEACRAAMEDRGHLLDLHLGDGPLWVLGDHKRLTQVVSNLLANAARYTLPGGHVGLTLDTERDEAVLRVRDDGPGIAPQMLTRIFETFTQVDRGAGHDPAATPQGLGLGLSLVKGLMELHGGTVVAESDGPGHGSVFTVRLPLFSPDPSCPAPRGR